MANDNLWNCPAGETDRDDRALATAVLCGNRLAIRQLVERFAPLVRAYVMRRLRLPAADADDLVQRLFANLWADDWQALRQWRGDRLAPYLLAIARNLALDMIRARTPPGRPADPEDPARPDWRTPERPERWQFRRELQAAIEACLAQAPARDRRLIEAFHFQGHTYKEIAAQLRITVNAVGVALHRAEARLRSCLERRHPGFVALTSSWIRGQ